MQCIAPRKPNAFLNETAVLLMMTIVLLFINHTCNRDLAHNTFLTKPPTTSSFHNNADGAESTDREVFQQLILQQSQILAQQGEFLKLLQSQSSSSRNSAASLPSSRFRGNCLYCHKYGHRISECRKRLAKEANSRPPPQTTSSAYNQRQFRTTPSQVNRGLSTEQSPTANQQKAPIYTLRTTPATCQPPTIPMRKLTIEDAEPITCVTDSGAVVSLVSSNFVDTLGHTADQTLESDSHLIAAEGNPLDLAGKIHLDLSFGDAIIRHPFQIANDFPFPVLLGCDFLSRVRAVISYANGTVTFTEHGSAVPITLSILEYASFRMSDMRFLISTLAKLPRHMLTSPACLSINGQLFRTPTSYLSLVLSGTDCFY